MNPAITFEYVSEFISKTFPLRLRARRQTPDHVQAQLRLYVEEENLALFLEACIAYRRWVCSKGVDAGHVYALENWIRYRWMSWARWPATADLPEGQCEEVVPGLISWGPVGEA